MQSRCSAGLPVRLNPLPWLPPSGTLFAILATALAIALFLTWRRARSDPAPAIASALVLMSVA